MLADDLDLPAGKLGEAAQRVLDRAALESRRRGHADVTPEHLCLALAEVEWGLFAEVMRAVGLNPQAIVIEGEDVVTACPSVDAVDVRVTLDTRRLLRLALHRATRDERQSIVPADLFAALLDAQFIC